LDTVYRNLDVTRTTNKTNTLGEAGCVYPVLETYRAWVDTLAGYMKRAVELLEGLYAEQDRTIGELRDRCARSRSIRHADFDAVFGGLLAERRTTRESAAALVERYRAGREEVIEELRDTLGGDLAGAAAAWPALKQRLLVGEDDKIRQIVSALRGVHVEQEKISTALSSLLLRGDKLKLDDLKTVARRLASGDSRETAELAALLGVCESAGHAAGLKWQRLAG
jgi:hypothetical protein